MSDMLPEMIPRTALGDTEPRLETHGDTVLAEICDLALASVTARSGAENGAATALLKLLKAPAPTVEAMVQKDKITAFWTGPNQWMITAPHSTHELLADTVKSVVEDTASVTEQNDAWAVFDLTGNFAPVMELLCPINMRAFDVDTARRTSIDHLGCFVTRISDNGLRIYGPRSSAGSLHHAILTAMRAAL